MEASLVNVQGQRRKNTLTNKRPRTVYFNWTAEVARACLFMLGMIVGEGISWIEAAVIFCSTLHALCPELYPSASDFVSEGALRLRWPTTDSTALREWLQSSNAALLHQKLATEFVNRNLGEQFNLCCYLPNATVPDVAAGVPDVAVSPPALVSRLRYGLCAANHR
jgi:hypothetical protein